MLSRLKPDMVCHDVTSIDIDALIDMNVRALVFDLDNTLTLWNDINVPRRVKEWVGSCRRRGLKMCICSNNHTPRIQPVADELELDFICDAGKPSPDAYRRAIDLLGVEARYTAAVGDQLMTDVIGAKRAGLHTILVSPMGRREFVGTYFNRMLESPLLHLMGIKRK